MIKIFNKKLKTEIQIDDSLSFVTFSRNEYDDIPSIKIELKGFDFLAHTYTCKDCKSFLDSMGTSTTDWFVEYSNFVKRLDLSKLGKKFEDNNLRFRISEFDNGSVLKLNLSSIPDKKEELELLIQKEANDENYEYCAVLRDIKSEIE